MEEGREKETNRKRDECVRPRMDRPGEADGRWRMRPRRKAPNAKKQYLRKRTDDRDLVETKKKKKCAAACTKEVVEEMGVKGG